MYIVKRKQEICNAFNRYASQYDVHALAQKEVGNTLIERLDYIKLSPTLVLDVGCGTGFFTNKLQQRFPNAKVLGIDFAKGMIQEARRQYPDLEFLVADMHELPLAMASVDLIFSNQVVHWSFTPLELFKEFNRVMNPNACLMLSSVGPDAYREIRIASKQINGHAHVNSFLDMHDLGDCILKAGLSDPVIDADQIELHYTSFEQMIRALKAQGVRNVNSSKHKALTGKTYWNRLRNIMNSQASAEGIISLTFEVVFGQAWKNEIQPCKNQETTVELSRMRRMLRQSLD